MALRQIVSFSALAINRLTFPIVKCVQHVPLQNYALPAKKLGKAGGKLGPMLEKKVLEVETDTEKLTTYVCGSNIHKEGEDVKLKEDSEYPDWLWSIRLGKPPELEDMDPNTLEYWRRYRKLAKRRELALRKGKKF